ncbi:hypothetical protein GJ496_009564 [Pomphorhynchus laevis]|nr:hypothetical protein GJ496_009564 [Pomphorhynchus laevis]
MMLELGIRNIVCSPYLNPLAIAPNNWAAFYAQIASKLLQKCFRNPRFWNEISRKSFAVPVFLVSVFFAVPVFIFFVNSLRQANPFVLTIMDILLSHVRNRFTSPISAQVISDVSDAFLSISSNIDKEAPNIEKCEFFFKLIDIYTRNMPVVFLNNDYSVFETRQFAYRILDFLFNLAITSPKDITDKCIKSVQSIIRLFYANPKSDFDLIGLRFCNGLKNIVIRLLEAQTANKLHRQHQMFDFFIFDREHSRSFDLNACASALKIILTCIGAVSFELENRLTPLATKDLMVYLLLSACCCQTFAQTEFVNTICSFALNTTMFLNLDYFKCCLLETCLHDIFRSNPIDFYTIAEHLFVHQDSYLISTVLHIWSSNSHYLFDNSLSNIIFSYQPELRMIRSWHVFTHAAFQQFDAYLKNDELVLLKPELVRWALCSDYSYNIVLCANLFSSLKSLFDSIILTLRKNQQRCSQILSLLSTSFQLELCDSCKILKSIRHKLSRFLRHCIENYENTSIDINLMYYASKFGVTFHNNLQCNVGSLLDLCARSKEFKYLDLLSLLDTNCQISQQRRTDYYMQLIDRSSTFNFDTNVRWVILSLNHYPESIMLQCNNLPWSQVSSVFISNIPLILFKCRTTYYCKHDFTGPISCELINWMLQISSNIKDFASDMYNFVINLIRCEIPKTKYVLRCIFYLLSTADSTMTVNDSGDDILKLCEQMRSTDIFGWQNAIITFAIEQIDYMKSANTVKLLGTLMISPTSESLTNNLLCRSIHLLLYAYLHFSISEAINYTAAILAVHTNENDLSGFLFNLPVQLQYIVLSSISLITSADMSSPTIINAFLSCRFIRSNKLILLCIAVVHQNAELYKSITDFINDDLILNSVPFIYKILITYFHEQADRWQSSLEYCARLSKCSLRSLTVLTRQSICEQIIGDADLVSCFPERVLAILRLVARISNEGQNNEGTEIANQLDILLQPRIPGILLVLEKLVLSERLTCVAFLLSILSDKLIQRCTTRFIRILKTCCGCDDDANIDEKSRQLLCSTLYAFASKIQMSQLSPCSCLSLLSCLHYIDPDVSDDIFIGCQLEPDILPGFTGVKNISHVMKAFEFSSSELTVLYLLKITWRIIESSNYNSPESSIFLSQMHCNQIASFINSNVEFYMNNKDTMIFAGRILGSITITSSHCLMRSFTKQEDILLVGSNSKFHQFFICKETGDLQFTNEWISKYLCMLSRLFFTLNNRDAVCFCIQEAHVHLRLTSVDLPEPVKDVLSMFSDSKLRIKSAGGRKIPVLETISNTLPSLPSLNDDKSDNWHVKLCLWLFSKLPDKCNTVLGALNACNLLFATVSDSEKCEDAAKVILPALLAMLFKYGETDNVHQFCEFLMLTLNIFNKPKDHTPTLAINDRQVSIHLAIEQLRIDRFDGVDDLISRFVSLQFIRNCLQFNALLALYYCSWALKSQLIVFDLQCARLLQEAYCRLEDLDNVVGVTVYYQNQFPLQKDLALKARSCEAKGLDEEARECFRLLCETENSDQWMNAYEVIDEKLKKSLLESCEVERQSCFKFLSKFDFCSSLQPIFNEISNNISTSNKSNSSKTLNSMLDNFVIKEISFLKEQNKLNRIFFMEARLHRSFVRLKLLEELRQSDLSFRCTGKSSTDTVSDIKCGTVKSTYIRDSSHLLKFELDLYLQVKRQCCIVRSDLPESYRRRKLVELYVKHAELCRLEGSNHRLASGNRFLLRAEHLDPECPVVILERAKWLNVTGRQLDAIIELEGALVKSSDLESMLLYAQWKSEASLVDNYKLLELYQNAANVHPNCEEAHFQLARFLDSTTGCTTENKFLLLPRSIELTVKSYCESILHRSSDDSSKKSYLLQSLPRVFTLWFLSGRLTYLAENAQPGQWSHLCTRTLSKHIEHLTLTIRTTIRSIPTQQLLQISISQLTSRLCHPHPVVSSALIAILARILIDFPHQTLWRLVSVSQSSYDRRKERCNRLFDVARKKCNNSDELSKLIKNCLDVSALFVELCERPIRNNVTEMSMKKSFPTLKRRLDHQDGFHLLIPIHNQLFMVSSSINEHKVTSSFLQEQRSSNELIFFTGIEDKISIMRSLQKPKRIVVRASDGCKYNFLCKAKDDLRIDHRLLEVANLANQCFSNQEDFRLYAVTPLSEQCGLIEWIPNQETLNSAMQYPDTLIASVREIYPPVNSSARARLDVFENRILSKFKPSRLHRWFLRQFDFVSDWYSACKRFTRSAAAWSILGYIIGLGDRHCDNIMLDQLSGQCVHVDFNCLFNKGESLPIPEIVPFRLTHNIVDALGPVGVEGQFRISCQLILAEIRRNSSLLINVLETFVFDPLVEWKGYSKIDEIKPPEAKCRKLDNDIFGAGSGAGEIFNSMAQTNIERINNRLSGCTIDNNDSVKKQCNLPVKLHAGNLSVEGHVDLLIKQASDLDLLSQMYIGWSSFL